MCLIIKNSTLWHPPSYNNVECAICKWSDQNSRVLRGPDRLKLRIICISVCLDCLDHTILHFSSINPVSFYLKLLILSEFVWSYLYKWFVSLIYLNLLENKWKKQARHKVPEKGGSYRKNELLSQGTVSVLQDIGTNSISFQKDYLCVEDCILEDCIAVSYLSSLNIRTASLFIKQHTLNLRQISNHCFVKFLETNSLISSYRFRI